MRRRQACGSILKRCTLARRPADPEFPLYLAWNVFARYPELLEDFELSPRFVEDWLPFLPEAFRKILDGRRDNFPLGS